MATTSDSTSDGLAEPRRDGGRLLAILAGQSCPACDDGQLERGTYKGNRAVLCDNCETPRAQVW